MLNTSAWLCLQHSCKKPCNTYILSRLHPCMAHYHTLEAFTRAAKRPFRSLDATLARALSKSRSRFLSSEGAALKLRVKNTIRGEGQREVKTISEAGNYQQQQHRHREDLEDSTSREDLEGSKFEKAREASWSTKRSTARYWHQVRKECYWTRKLSQMQIQNYTCGPNV